MHTIDLFIQLFIHLFLCFYSLIVEEIFVLIFAFFINFFRFFIGHQQFPSPDSGDGDDGRRHERRRSGWWCWRRFWRRRWRGRWRLWLLIRSSWKQRWLLWKRERAVVPRGRRLPSRGRTLSIGRVWPCRWWRGKPADRRRAVGAVAPGR